MTRLSSAVALALALFILPAQSGAQGISGGASYGAEPVAKLATVGEPVVGEPARIRGTVAAAGSPVFVQVKQGSGKWADVGATAADERGKFELKWSPKRDGLHTLRASTTPLDAQASAANAPLEEDITVFRAAKATWYGPGLYGNRTACGQTLTKQTIGVAHRKLPCGTKVAIAFGGKRTIAKVIDRGPFAHGADWDLTAATARRLGMRATSEILVAPLR